MSTWVFVAGLGFIVLYTVLQVPAVLYLSKYFELEDGEEVDPTGGVFDDPGSRPHISDDNYEAIYVPGEDEAPPTNDEGATCAICGTENDPEYTYCQNCLAHL